MRIFLLSPQGESSLAKSRQMKGPGGRAQRRCTEREEMVCVRPGVWFNSPFSSGRGALTQESPNSLPNKPALQLGPAPNTCAKAWIPLVETQVIGVHQDSHFQRCLAPYHGHNMHAPPLPLSGKCYHSILIDWPGSCTQVLRHGTSRMLSYNLSKSCPSCQTSEDPARPSVGVSKSSSYHFLGLVSFSLDDSNPVARHPS